MHAGRSGPSVLTVPAQPSMIATIRRFVAAVAAAHTADQERIDDLQLAVSEACAGGTGASITVTVSIRAGTCSVTCEGVSVPGDDEAGSMREQLLAALAPDAHWSRTRLGGSVHFSLPLH